MASSVGFHVGDIVRAVRLSRKLTLVDLAADAGLTLDAVTLLERAGPDAPGLHLSDLLACVKALDFDLYAAYAALEKHRARDSAHVDTSTRLTVAPFVNRHRPTATLTLTLDREFRLRSATVLEPQLTMFGQKRLDAYLGDSHWRDMIGEPFRANCETRVRACFETQREQTVTYERVLPWSAGRAYPHELRFAYDAATACVTMTSYLMPATAGQPLQFVCCREHSNCVECFVAQGEWKMTSTVTQQTG